MLVKWWNRRRARQWNRAYPKDKTTYAQKLARANKPSDLSKWYVHAYENNWPEAATLASAITGSIGGDR